MAKAQIRMPDGTQVTIEGSPAEVATIVAKLHHAGPPTRGRASSRPSNEAKDAKSQRTASDLVASLKEEGFFDKPKRLGDVARKLEEGGFLYPVTTLSGVVLSLVKKKILTRKKVDGVWTYGKR